MLFIVATPIGNLEDLSLRAAKILANSDITLAEDTRSYLKLKRSIEDLFRIKINKEQEVISYYKEVEAEKLPVILNLLKQGKQVSLISESGTPLINDPGLLLVKTVIQEQIPFTFIPGPTAFVSAVVFSGFGFKEVVFLGYFPKKKINKFLLKIKETALNLKSPVFVFYESPHRIKKTVKTLLEFFKDRISICLCRELTKRFEERIFIDYKEDLEKIVERGEYTVVVKIY